MTTEELIQQNKELLNQFKKIKKIADSQGWTSVEVAATTQLITDLVLKKHKITDFDSLKVNP